MEGSKGRNKQRLKVLGVGARRDCDIAGTGCASETRRMCQRKEVPAQLLPGPSQLTCWPRSHLVMLTACPSTPTAHQLLTKDNNCSVAFQTQTWDLYFSLKINILKAVFFLTVPAQVVFNYLRKAFLAQANLFTVCLVELAYKPAFRDLLYNIIKKAIFEKNRNHLQQHFFLLCKWLHRSQIIKADHPNLLDNAYSKWKYLSSVMF